MTDRFQWVSGGGHGDDGYVEVMVWIFLGI